MVCFAPSAHAWCRSTTCQGDDCPRDDEGCKTTGHPLAWPSLCAGFSVQAEGTVNLPFDDVRGVIEKAFLTWSGLACKTGAASIAFSETPQVACHAVEYNPSGMNADVILFQDTKWPHPDVSDALAKTTVSFDVNTGAILDADVEVNSAYNDLTLDDGTVVYDLQSILTHEIGHFIGLDHSLVVGATMNASYDEGTLRRTLAADDVAGACQAYPPDRAGRCDPTPRGGFSAECGSASGASGETHGGCSTEDHRDPSGAGAIVLIASATLFASTRRRSMRGRA